MNTCVSRNLLLVPPKIQILKFEMTKKRGGGGGVYFGGFF